MLRVLKPGGKALVTVWAKEQKYKEKESFYISQKANKTDDSSSKVPKKKIKIPENEAESSPLCHKFGNEFQKQDLFVAWHYSNKTGKKIRKETEEAEAAVESDPKDREEKVYLRFYHVFQDKELEELFEKIPNAKVLESYYEQGNWCAIFEKVNE
jgi:alkylated DNA repair protein alkB family protein 8